MSDDTGSLASEERFDVLRALASQPVSNVLCIDDSFAFCPMPSEIEAMGFESSGTDASIGQVLDAIPAAADQAAVIGALEEARRTGVGTAHIDVVETEDVEAPGGEGPTGICMVDMTGELGVYVVVVGELVHKSVEKLEIPDAVLRPRRLVQYRDETARFVRIDPLTEALLGWTEEDLLWASALDFIHPDDRDRGIQSWMEMLAGRTGIRYRVRFRTKDGDYRWLEIANEHQVDDPGSGVVATEMVDVDDEMSALARVRAGERQFKTLTESLPVGVVQVDTDTNLVFANEWIQRIADFEVESLSSREDLEPIHPDDRGSLTAAFRTAIDDGEQTDLNIRVRNAHTGGEHLCLVRVRPLRADDEIYGAIATIEDITESASLQDQLRVQASTDHLTGLPNRGALSEGVQRLLDASVGRDDDVSLAVLFIDLDRFKLVNDGLGHDAGDEILVEVGDRLKSTLRSEDVIARVGGDEFVIVCPWTQHLEDAARLADRILDRLHQPFIASGTVASVGASIGIAMHDGTAATADVLIGNADLAMYEAKRAGGGRWEPYGDELRSVLTERFEVQRTITGALRNEEFSLFLQPVRELATGRAVAAECLVRWHHPTRGLIPPGQFVPVAEESDFIVTLGRWILDEACRIGARVVAQGAEDFRISVNVSGRQLGHPGFEEEFLETVERHRLKPSNLILEVTETVFVETDTSAIAVLQALAGSGATLALDDFGTGYSSLNHLRVMPVTMLKIDSSYTADLGFDSGTTAIMESMGDLSRRLGLELVAEGIESQEQQEMAHAMGFTLGQGYWLGRPRDEDTFFADFDTESNASESTVSTLET